VTIRPALPLAVAFAFLFAFPTIPAAQTDLDAFMERVLARRDENWKKMQQYILDEEERLQLMGPLGTRLYGFDRDYIWFIRDGVFVRSPIKVDGVTIDEAARTKAEREWIEREKSREKRRQERAAGQNPPEGDHSVTISPRGVEYRNEKDDVVALSLEPRFVSAAYFLRFKFDPGHYALAGREKLDGHDVLRIEYYPSKLFSEGRSRPDKRIREKDDQIEEKMNKVSLVTLWIDPKAHQILQYTFDNIDMDFLPGRSIVRLDELKASMKMTQPFPGVWLPGSIEMRFGMTMAIGPITARYETAYHDYRLAEVTTKIRPPQ
jgi:hypothetical protein